MNLARRSFLRTTLGAGVLAASARHGGADEPTGVTDEQLERAAEAPVLRVEELTAPLKIASMELLRNGETFLVRVRTTGGDEGLGGPFELRVGHRARLLGIAATGRRRQHARPEGGPQERSASLVHGRDPPVSRDG